MDSVRRGAEAWQQASEECLASAEQIETIAATITDHITGDSATYVRKVLAGSAEDKRRQAQVCDSLSKQCREMALVGELGQVTWLAMGAALIVELLAAACLPGGGLAAAAGVRMAARAKWQVWYAQLIQLLIQMGIRLSSSRAALITHGVVAGGVLGGGISWAGQEWQRGRGDRDAIDWRTVMISAAGGAAGGLGAGVLYTPAVSSVLRRLYAHGTRAGNTAAMLVAGGAAGVAGGVTGSLGGAAAASAYAGEFTAPDGQDLYSGALNGALEGLLSGGVHTVGHLAAPAPVPSPGGALDTHSTPHITGIGDGTTLFGPARGDNVPAAPPAGAADPAGTRPNQDGTAGPVMAPYSTTDDDLDPYAPQPESVDTNQERPARPGPATAVSTGSPEPHRELPVAKPPAVGPIHSDVDPTGHDAGRMSTDSGRAVPPWASSPGDHSDSRPSSPWSNVTADIAPAELPPPATHARPAGGMEPDLRPRTTESVHSAGLPAAAPSLPTAAPAGNDQAKGPLSRPTTPWSTNSGAGVEYNHHPPVKSTETTPPSVSVDSATVKNNPPPITDPPTVATAHPDGVHPSSRSDSETTVTTPGQLAVGDGIPPATAGSHQGRRDADGSGDRTDHHDPATDDSDSDVMGPAVATSSSSAKRHRVLLVSYNWNAPDSGGRTAFNRQLAASLAEAGHEVFARIGQVPLPGTELPDGVTLVAPQSGTSHTKHIGPETRHEQLIADLDTLPEGIDTVISQGHAYGAAGRFIRENRYPDAALVHFVHADGYGFGAVTAERPFGRRVKIRKEREAVAGADLVVGVGPVLADYGRRLATEAGVDTHVHEFIPGGGNHEFSTGNQATELIPMYNPEGPYRVLVFGRASDPRKGVWEAARMIRLLRAEGIDVSLTVRGVPEEKADSTRTLLSATAGHEVTVKPYHRNHAAVLWDMRETNLVIMPSFAESFGLVITEALGAGVPALAPDSSGVGRFLRSRFPSELTEDMLVEQEYTGLVRPADWAEKIQRQLGDQHGIWRKARELREALIADDTTWLSETQKLVHTIDNLRRRHE
ncbi:glycosyltransferase [Nocardia fusca]|uniref:glycosyltransferase n=1 Tax=Nocardia fusca TaxID=941183 RepID=UPI0037B66D9D